MVVERTDYAWVTNKKPAPMGVSDDDLYGAGRPRASDLETTAKSLVDACAADPSRRVESDEIQKHVEWLKELLA